LYGRRCAVVKDLFVTLVSETGAVVTEFANVARETKCGDCVR